MRWMLPRSFRNTSSQTTAVIKSVGYEKLRYVNGAVYVINKDKVLYETLDSVMRKLIEQANR